jgi:hypothetical protein
MKNITIEIPRNGALVQLKLRGTASAGQVVIVASDDVEIHLAEPANTATGRVESPPTRSTGKASGTKAKAYDLDGILKRLIKLKPTKRDTAVNSIMSMFQFKSPINIETANQILEDLRKRGSVRIDANSKLQFPT